MKKETYTIAQAAKVLGISPDSVKRLIKNGELSPLKPKLNLRKPIFDGEYIRDMAGLSKPKAKESEAGK